MSEARRQQLLIGVMLVLLLAGVGWCASEMLDRRVAAERAAAGLGEAELIAERVRRLEQQDKVASTAGSAQDQEQDLARRIKAAADRARITGNWQRGIDYKRARRVGDTPYKQKPTVVLTRGLTLEQLSALLYHLTHESPLTVTELTLKTPRGADPGRRWDADFTLTYLIYDPLDSGG